MIQLRFVVRSVVLLSLATILGCHVGMPVPVEETFEVQFDSRQWSMVFEGKEGTDEIKQYVPQGSTADNWTEMITSRSFPGLQATSTSEQAMGDKRKLAEEQCSKVDWQVIGQEPGSIRYTASFDGCIETRSPHEVGRFVMSDFAIYLVTYETKAKTFTPAQAKQWGDILARAGFGDRVLDESR